MKVREIPSDKEAGVLDYIARNPGTQGSYMVRDNGVKQGTVYVLLQRLRKRDLVRSEKAISNGRGSDPMRYWLTERGEKIHKLLLDIWSIDLG